MRKSAEDATLRKRPEGKQVGTKTTPPAAKSSKIGARQAKASKRRAQRVGRADGRELLPKEPTCRNELPSDHFLVVEENRRQALLEKAVSTLASNDDPEVIFAALRSLLSCFDTDHKIWLSTVPAAQQVDLAILLRLLHSRSTAVKLETLKTVQELIKYRPDEQSSQAIAESLVPVLGESDAETVVAALNLLNCCTRDAAAIALRETVSLVLDERSAVQAGACQLLPKFGAELLAVAGDLCDAIQASADRDRQSALMGILVTGLREAKNDDEIAEIIKPQLDPQIAISSLRGLGPSARDLRLLLTSLSSDIPAEIDPLQVTINRSPVDLTPREQEIVDILSSTGKRLTCSEILKKISERGKDLDAGALKPPLSRLVKAGILTNRSDKKPRGYGLPTWDR